MAPAEGFGVERNWSRCNSRRAASLPYLIIADIAVHVFFTEPAVTFAVLVGSVAPGAVGDGFHEQNRYARRSGETGIRRREKAAYLPIIIRITSSSVWRMPSLAMRPTL